MSGLAFRSWVKATRRRAGLTQAEVGDRCDPPIREHRISDIERGVKTPTMGEALEIRSVLDKAAAGNE